MKRILYNNIFVSLVILLLVSACALPGNTAMRSKSLDASLQSAAPVIGISAPICRLTSCTNFNPVPGTLPFPDTWQNIHRFQIFDYNVSDLANVAQNNDFVWSARPSHVASYHQLNPNLLLSYYLTIDRDNGISFLNSKTQNLAYWKQVHPDWIMYKCDRQTPAYVNYNDNSTDVPFMLNNLAMRQWQINTYIKPASEFGYDALAVDNVNMENLFGACGSYDANGQWVQRYTGALDDPQWQADVASWMTQMQQVAHALPHPLLLMINFGFGGVPINADASQQVIAHADGLLDEMGFAHYGEYFLSDDAWLQMVHLIDQVQRQNKAFFSINEFQHGITHEDMQWALASYLMAKQHLAMVSIANLGGYGINQDFPEYTIPIGNPQSEMYFSQNVYWRDYSGGEVLVNPSSTPLTITLPSAKSYTDPYGTPISGSLTLAANSARILLNH